MAASSGPLPANAHVSRHPCLRAKLSQLRVAQSSARETKLLIHEIATIVAVEALGSALQSVDDGEVGMRFFFSCLIVLLILYLIPPMFGSIHVCSQACFEY